MFTGITRRAFAAMAIAGALAAVTAARTPAEKKLAWTTKSKEAQDLVTLSTAVSPRVALRAATPRAA